jgi:hypothetical protein
VVLLVALQLVWGADVPWLPTHAMIGDVPALRSLRRLSSTFRGGDETRSRFRFDTGFRDLDQTLPRDATVLLHEEYVRLGLNRRAIADSARWQGAIDYRQLRRPDRVHDQLQGLGVTHLVWSRSHSVNREIPVSGELVFFFYAMRFGEETRDAGGFAVAKLPGRRPPPSEPRRVAYFGCKVARSVPLEEIDRVIADEGDPTPNPDHAELLASADFAVFNGSCGATVPPQLQAAFLQAPRWGDLTLWVRRP